MKKKCIVTGGCGFIGSHLVDLLVEKKFQVIVIDNLSTGTLKNLNPKAKLIRADLSNYKIWPKYFKKAKFVFHLAGLAELVSSIKDYDKYYKSNIEATFNIFKASKEFKCKKIIYTASSTCYGKPKNFPTSENDNIETLHPYAVTKYIGEDILLKFGKIFNVPIISARLFNVYGPRVRGTKGYGAVFTVFLTQKLYNKPFTIVGNGKQKRDFTFVGDIVEALFLLANKKTIKNEIVNIGSGNTISINKLANLIGGKKIFIPKRPGEPDITFGNINKINKILGWKPKIDIKEGVKIMLKHLFDYKDQPLWNKKKIEFATKDWFKFLK